jgi:putative DNA primase/helicase
LLLSAEDVLSDTIVPRLIAAGADLRKVIILRMVKEEGRDRMFSLAGDLEMLRQKIVDVGDVALIVIDPISAYLGIGKMDAFRATDVRAVLGPVTDLATELKVSIIAVMHFNKRLDVTNALLRISDSMAFGAAARHVYCVVNDPENQRKLLVRAKNNLATYAADTLAFTFNVREVGTDPNNNKTIMAPYVVWAPQYVDVTATEAMQAATNSLKSPSTRDEAKKFLLAMLASGPVPRADIEDAAEGNGIAERTLFRAKAELGVVATKDGADGKWRWRLPQDGDD